MSCFPYMTGKMLPAKWVQEDCRHLGTESMAAGSTLVTLQEWGRCGPTRTSVSELHSGSPLSRGRNGAASDFHCMTWSAKTTHHNTRLTQEEFCGRQGQVCEEQGHLSPFPPTPLIFAVRLRSPSTLQPITGGHPYNYRCFYEFVYPWVSSQSFISQDLTSALCRLE